MKPFRDGPRLLEILQSARDDLAQAAATCATVATYWRLLVIIDKCPLVNVYITMERSTIFAGKTHYFNGHVQNITFCMSTRGYCLIHGTRRCETLGFEKHMELLNKQLVQDFLRPEYLCLVTQPGVVSSKKSKCLVTVGICHHGSFGGKTPLPNLNGWKR